MAKITLRAPAKINFTLDVKERRPDGYHNVEMIMQSIDLSDEITIKDSAGEMRIRVDNPSVPVGLDNIALRAAYLVKDAYKINKCVDISIAKNIPMAAGLAGGSTDGAAVLVGLNILWGLGLKQEDIMTLALKLGADVPFCILGGTAIARGIGEILTPLPPASGIHIVLVKPPFSVSTTEVYDGLVLKDIKNRPDAATVAKELALRDLNALGRSLSNIMETVTIKRYPEIAFIKDKLIEQGAAAALMSGSGPTAYGIYHSYEQASNAYKNLNKTFSEVYLTQTTAKGIQTLKGGIR